MWRLLWSLMLLRTCSFVHSDPRVVPCYFIFGDSLSDAGNNNGLDTEAKANYAPYGIDFPGGGRATGRFTNGLTAPDILTKLLGIEGFIPPFSNSSGVEMLKGVNYASGAAGIRNESGSNWGDRIWLVQQVINHGTTITKLQSLVKGDISDYLSKCLYTVNIGSNDYINNYFRPQLFSSKKIFNPDQFATALVTEYEQQLKTLYNYGARNTAIFGLGLIGCTPIGLYLNNNSTQCIEEINDAVHLFNQKLLMLVKSLHLRLPGSKFTFIDIAAMQKTSPITFGPIAQATCCELRSDYQCEPSVPPCPIRNIYAFMDGFHPTQIVNEFIARLSFHSPLKLFVHPVDIYNLVSS